MVLSKDYDILTPSKGLDIQTPSMRIPEEEERDVISLLPDPILVHILSFLPTMDAIRTVQVRRFGNLWRWLRVLDLDECLFHEQNHNPDFEEDCHCKEKLMSIIHHALGLQESKTLDKFSLRINFNSTFSRIEDLAEDPEYDKYRFQEEIMGNRIETILHSVISKKVKVLDLDFRGCSDVGPLECYVLPDIVLKGDFLTELWLFSCEVGCCGEVNLRVLKFMSLREVVVSDKTMAIILQGCPMLETLSLTDCIRLKNLNCTNLRLERLILCLYEPNEILTVSFPNLLSLEIDGCIDQVRLVNVSSVLECCLLFTVGFRSEQNEYVEVKRIFQQLSNCKIFIPCTWCILVFSLWKLTNVPCPSFKWETLVLKLFLSKWHHPGISLLLRNSPFLETLTMYIYPPGQGTEFEDDEEKWLEAYDFDGENFWNSQEATFPHLKTVMIYGYITEPYVIDMAKFLLKNAIVLEEMVISTKKPPLDEWYVYFGPVKKDHFTSEGLLEYSQEIFSFPRASGMAVIHFN